MRLSKTDRVAGLFATEARELMRCFRSAQPESVISYWISPSGRTDADIARALAAEGYLAHNPVQDQVRVPFRTEFESRSGLAAYPLVALTHSQAFHRQANQPPGVRPHLRA